MQIDSKIIEGLFPKYRTLFERVIERPNDQLEYFIKEQLPDLVHILQNLESTFTKLLHSHSALILKKQPNDTLLQSFLRKISEKLEKFFSGLDDYVNKSPEAFEMFEFAKLREDVRSELEPLAELIARKLPQRGKNSGLERSKEEEIVQSIYMVVEYYQWTKSDSTSIGAKFRVSPSNVLEEIRSGLTVGDPMSLVALEASFHEVVAEYVQKKCRPFLQKRDFLVGKVKEICRETQGRVGSSTPKQYMRAILAREHARCDRDIINSLQQNIRQNPAPRQFDKEIPEINQEMTQIQNDFHRLKNNSYYLDIIRGNFIDSYQMETKKLENVFAMGRLEKYLQDVYALVERMKELLNKIVENRKGEKQELQYLIDKIVDGSVRDLEANFKQGIALRDLVFDELDKLKLLLAASPDNDDTSAVNNGADKFREQQQARERERQTRIIAERERREEQQRAKKQDIHSRTEKERQLREQRRVKEEERKIKEQEERIKREQQRRLEEIDRQRRLEAEKIEKEEKRRIEGEQLKIKQEQDRIKRQRETQQRERKMEETRQRQAQEENRRRQQEQLRKKKIEQDKKAAEEQKKRQQQQLDERRKRQQEQKAKQAEEQKQRKLDKEKLEKEKQKQLQDERRRQEQRKRQEQEERDRRAAEQRKNREQKQQEQRKRQEQRKKVELARIQKQKEEAAKKEDERLQKEAQDKKKKQEEKRQRQEREREERAKVQREKEEQQARERDRKEREAAEKKRADLEKKQRQERQRVEAERKRKQLEAEKKRKQEEERKEKERLENERKEKQRRDEQKRKEEERQREEERREKQRLEREKRQQQKRERERLEAERLDKERKEKQKKEEQARQKRLEQESKVKKPAGVGKDSKKPAKSSAIDYANAYDDDDDIVDEELNPMKKPIPPVKPADKSKQPPKKDNDFDFLNDDIDFGMDDSPKKPSPNSRNPPQISPKDEYADDFQPADEGEESQGQTNFDTKQLMSGDNVKLFNDYLKGTQYARKNKVNLEPFNNFEQFIGLFEEFMQNREVYFVDPAITRQIFELPAAMEDPRQYEQHATQILQAMSHSYQNNLQQLEFDLETRYFFPLNFPNPLNCRVVEFCPIVKDFVLFLNGPMDQAQQVQEFLERLVDCFCELFGVHGGEEEAEEVPPQLQTIMLSPDNLSILNTFDNLLPSLLILFNYMYEYKNRSALVIDQYTIDRFFYTSHGMDPMYKAIEGEEEKLNEHFEKLQTKFESDKAVKVIARDYSLADPQFSDKMLLEFKSDKESFIKGQVGTVLSCLSFEQSEGKLGDNSEQQVVPLRCVYCEMTKAQPKPILNLYLFESDQDSSNFNQAIFSRLISQEDPRFELSVYLDFTRHNGLYEYKNYSLPLWAHVTVKKKMKPAEALAVINFSMLPILACYRNQD